MSRARDAAIAAHLRQYAADSYAFWHHQDRRSVREERQQLARLEQLGGALAEWLALAGSADESPTRAVARLLNAALLERGASGHEALEAVQTNLVTLLAATGRVREYLAPDKRPRSARLMAAAMLWEYLPARGIKVTIYERGEAVWWLVWIARKAGDRTLTPRAARDALAETRPNRRASTAK